jgi:hypothetical protein
VKSLFSGLLASAALLIAGSRTLQLNVVYECDGQRIKVLNCDGAADEAVCEVESYATLPGGRGPVRSKVKRKALLISLRPCHIEAPAIPAGRPPKPGLTSCAGKIDGAYLGPSGYPSIVFHSGKASVEGDEEVECWTGGGKIYLHTAGTSADQDFVMGINSNGTFDTPLGEMKKKNN